MTASVVNQSNEGARPKPKAKLVLLSPPSNVTLCVPDASTERIAFAWRGVAGPYRLQVAEDREFKNVVYEDKDLSTNSARAPALKPGRYVWRVGVGSSSIFSEASWFKITEDCAPENDGIDPPSV
jgi:hypothetical protein